MRRVQRAMDHLQTLPETTRDRVMRWTFDSYFAAEVLQENEAEGNAGDAPS